MFGSYQEFDFNGHRYVIDSRCLGEDAYYIAPNGEKQYLPVHGDFMTAMDAVKIHAMNMNDYCP